jgi:hypothetical protein
LANRGRNNGVETMNDIEARIAELRRTAETGEQWAEICRLEAELNGGPFFDAPLLDDMSRVVVCGSHGRVIADWQSGDVIEVCHEGGEPDAYSDIRRFDFAEYRRTYAGEPQPGSIDILDVGYWSADESYEPADPEHRAMIAADMRSVTVGAAVAPAVRAIVTGE